MVAQQLTYIELERLNNIGPEEFIQTFVKSTEEKEVSYGGEGKVTEKGVVKGVVKGRHLMYLHLFISLGVHHTP